MVVIKTNNGFYYKGGVSGFHYTPYLSEAKRFEFEYPTILFAMEWLDLNASEFIVERV